MHLPVDVRLGNHVEINQRDPADRRTRQAFDRPRTNTADADDSNMGTLQTAQCAGAIEAGNAAETASRIACRFAHRASAARRMTRLNGSIHSGANWVSQALISAIARSSERVRPWLPCFSITAS